MSEMTDLELVRFWLPDEDAPDAHVALDRIEARMGRMEQELRRIGEQQVISIGNPYAGRIRTFLASLDREEARG